MKRDVGKVSADADAAKKLAEQTKKELEELKQQVAKLTESTTAAAAAAATSSASSQENNAAGDAAASTDRCLARMGGLGWDTAAAELERRATSALADCGIANETITAIAAAAGRAGTGSACEVLFKSCNDLQAARLLVTKARLVLHPPNLVWLDTKRTPAEIMIGQKLRKLRAAIEESVAAIAGSGERPVVSSRFAARSVEVNSERVASLNANAVVWTTAGKTRFDSSARGAIGSQVL